MKIFIQSVGFVILCVTFAVQPKSHIYESVPSFETGTNLQERHTGASPAVISPVPGDLGCSDLSSLFYLKSFFMQPKNDDRTGLDKACTPANAALTAGCLIYAPLSAAEHDLLNTLLSLSPPLKRIRIIFNRSNVVLLANIRRNGRTVASKQPSFALACESFFIEIEKKKSLPKNKLNKQQS